MPCCDCASMCSTARRDLERRGAWRSPSHIRNSVPIILHGIWTGCLTFATSILLLFQFCRLTARARARLPFGFRYPDAARPTQVSRSLRVAGAAFRLPVPPRACCCSWPFRGRAPPGRSLNRQGPASSGSVALSVSRALPVRQSPRAARRRRPESGVGATVSPCAVCAPLRCRCGKIAVSGVRRLRTKPAHTAPPPGPAR